jgi:dihydrofolate reductase
MIISIIVAVAENGVIGSDNRLPWRLPDDLKRFKALSLGKPVVMGRRTFESIGRPLPGRTNIIVSRQPGLAIEGAIVAPSLDAAISAAGAVPEVVVIGGADIFRLALPRTDTIHLTRVHGRVAGDVRFPELDPAMWRETAVEHHTADERHQYAFSFVTLQRIAT